MVTFIIKDSKEGEKGKKPRNVLVKAIKKTAKV